MLDGSLVSMSGSLSTKFGEPGRIFGNAEIEAVHLVVDGVVAKVYFLGERAFKQIHERGAHAQVFAERIIKTRPDHAPTLETKKRVVFKTDVHALARLQDGIVQDAHLTDVVVDRVICAFAQRRSAGGYAHRTRRQVEGAEGYFRGSARFVGAAQHESVELLVFPRHGKGGTVVQLLG
jgi:hypothetical protein